MCINQSGVLAIEFLPPTWTVLIQGCDVAKLLVCIWSLAQYVQYMYLIEWMLAKSVRYVVAKILSMITVSFSVRNVAHNLRQACLA